eukprot:GFYU01001867.1.p1 GENE.GFYU01001867.1~~GFYU01001867.1.p1  ORF type:complete len:210 (-),score=71.25 GFYU01001867.1:343-930(-)
MADSILGIATKDFAILAADATVAHSILVQKADEDKILSLDSTKLLASGGDAGDRVAFSEYLQKYMNLYELQNGYGLSTKAAAHFARNELATAIRKGPYMTNIILAGYDEKRGAEMYWCDYLGCMNKLDKAAHGYAGYFALSTMDRMYKDDMTFDEALECIKTSIKVVKGRFLLNMPNFIIKAVDKNGVRVIDMNA